MAKKTRTTKRTRAKTSTKATKSSNVMGADMSLGGAVAMLGMLGSSKGMFSGMKVGGLKVGDKAIVTGESVNMKGHEPPAQFAQLSDGSKLTLRGPNKGLIVK